MESKRKKACAAASAAIAAHHLLTINAMSLVVSLSASTNRNRGDRKPSGRYKRHGAIPAPRQSIWMRVDDVGLSDEMEFFMFLGLSRDSFTELVEI